MERTDARSETDVPQPPKCTPRTRGGAAPVATLSSHASGRNGTPGPAHSFTSNRTRESDFPPLSSLAWVVSIIVARCFFAPQALRAQMAAGRQFSPTSEEAFFSRKHTRVRAFVFLSFTVPFWKPIRYTLDEYETSWVPAFAFK